MASNNSIPKAILYFFEGSVWASVPLLTAVEKGYTAETLEKRQVNLLKGENFSPSYLKINRYGTVPTLVVPYGHTAMSEEIPTKYKSLLSTEEICSFLDSATLSSSHAAPSLSPATISGQHLIKDLLKLVHGPEAPDPNAFLLSIRNDEERKAKNASLPGDFLRGRQEALERYAKEAGDEDARLAAYYESKIKENGSLLAIYEGRADGSSFYAASSGMYTALPTTLGAIDAAALSSISGPLLEGSAATTTEAAKADRTIFLTGDQLSLADLHVGAWFARILAAVGAEKLEDTEAGFKKLEGVLPEGKTLGKGLKAWWRSVSARPSFKEVYGPGLH